MHADPRVERYIAAAYRSVTPTAPELGYEEMLCAMVRSLGEFLVAKGVVTTFPIFDLRAIYAFDKTSSVVSVRGRHTVLANRFFIQTLNNLNKILFADVDSSLPMFCYLFRLMKEQAYAKRYDELAIFISKFEEIAGTRPPWQKVIRFPADARHAGFTAVQEAFVLAHEIVHLLFAEGILHLPEHSLENQALSQLFIRGLDELGTDSFANRFMKEATESANSRHFDEELFCDRLAFEFAFANFRDELTPEEMYCAAKCFLMHMRVLDLLRGAFDAAECAKARDGTNPSRSSRSWLRYYSESFLPILETDRGFEPACVIKSWNALIDAHYAKITDISLKCIDSAGPVVSVGNLCFDVATRDCFLKKGPSNAKR